MISVIVPVYNVLPYLDECVNSIINQSYRKLDIILVDDGSTDGSGSRCDELALTDYRINVIHKENGGLSSARNRGIEAAKGEYIAFVDSDDYIADNYIERLRQMLDEHPECGMAVAEYNRFTDGECVLSQDSKNDCTIIKRNEIIETLDFCMSNDYTLYTVAWNKMYRRALWNTLRYPEGRWHEDEFVIHHLIDMVDYVACTTDELYFYRNRGGSIINVEAADDLNCKHFDVLYALTDRVDLYINKYPEYLERLMHYLLRKCYVFVYEYSRLDEKIVKNKVKDAIELYKESYHHTRNLLGIVERTKACLFITFPKLYSFLAMEKERRNNG